MKTFLFSEIEKVFVNGSCNGEIKTFFSNLKNNLFVKPEDADEQHPMEIERKARKKAREEASLRRQQEELEARIAAATGGRGTRAGVYQPYGYIRPDAYITTTTSNNDYESIRDTFLKKLKNTDSYNSIYSNSIIIVSGDCGLGSNTKEGYYNKVLEKFNKILQYNNTFVILLRGENDDPSFFNEMKIDLSNIKAVPDYSVIQTKNKNILCIGGAISVDRIWKKEQENRINSLSGGKKKIFFWENEAPIFNIENIKDVIDSVKKIDYVVSHTAPSFVTPVEIDNLGEWVNKDASLVDDTYQERLVMDKVFETLRDSGSKPEYWAYGHFGIDNIEKRSNTIFRSVCSGFNPQYVDNDLTTFGSVKKSGKKLKATFSKKNMQMARFEPAQPRPGNPWIGNPWITRHADDDWIEEAIALDDETHEDPDINNGMQENNEPHVIDYLGNLPHVNIDNETAGVAGAQVDAQEVYERLNHVYEIANNAVTTITTADGNELTRTNLNDLVTIDGH